jgi:hypothetical protein
MPQPTARIEIAVEGADAAELNEATSRLRAELLQLDADLVDVPSADQPPPGAKVGAEVALIGVLFLTVPNSAILSGIVQVIRSWLQRSKDRSVRLEINGDVLDVKGMSDSQQSRLIDAWLARHYGSES